MTKPTVTITITKEAADCLAYFATHPMYGPTISASIMDLTQEWFCRERKNMEQCINHDYSYLPNDQAK